MLIRFLFASAILQGLLLPAGADPISLHDTTFIIEEAFRADSPVHQHVIGLSGDDWSYTFTHEWAGETPHLFSWSLPVTLGEGGGKAALGTASLDYRYQIGGRDHDRRGFSPRLSLLVPLDDIGGQTAGAGFSAPLTFTHGDRTATHWSVAGSWIPQQGGSVSEVSAGAGIVRIVSASTAMVVEATLTWSRERAGGVSASSERLLVVSPGFRRLMRLGGLAMKPGIAFPIEIASGGTSAGVAFHLMLERSLRD